MTLELTQETIKEVLENNEKVLIDFYSSWCGPCKKMAPIIDEIAEESDDTVVIAKIDGGEFHKIAQEYNITGVPTLVLFKNGEEVSRLNGLKSKSTILKLLS